MSAAIIDTPYGFQENADELSERTVRFFAENVGREFARRVLPVARDVDAVAAATAVARIRESATSWRGPGSPSYALRQWAGGPIPAALADQLRGGGILTMASAAALTLGAVTIPVYEIYKVGAAPIWLPGLDLLGPATGLRAAVVPHYDNAEGGNHDTRFCYMGERRLRHAGAGAARRRFVLGIDSHTALVLDLDARTADARTSAASRPGRRPEHGASRRARDVASTRWPRLRASWPRASRPTSPRGGPRDGRSRGGRIGGPAAPGVPPRRCAT